MPPSREDRTDDVGGEGDPTRCPARQNEEMTEIIACGTCTIPPSQCPRQRGSEYITAFVGQGGWGRWERWYSCNVSVLLFFPMRTKPKDPPHPGTGCEVDKVCGNLHSSNQAGNHWSPIQAHHLGHTVLCRDHERLRVDGHALGAVAGLVNPWNSKRNKNIYSPQMSNPPPIRPPPK